MRSTLAQDVIAHAESTVKPTAALRITVLFVLVLNAIGCGSRHAPSAFMVAPSLTKADVKGFYSGALLKQVVFNDIDGPGLLLLSRSEQTVPAQDDEEPMDQITLRAELFRRGGQAAPWASRWSVEDPVQCEGLDLEAGYFLDQVTATDLDNDGRAELTLASHSFCGGGVDPQQLRIGLRQGEQYYEVRGESLVQVEGDEPFGGERQDDPALASAAPAVRAHVDRVWEAITRGHAGAP